MVLKVEEKCKSLAIQKYLHRNKFICVSEVLKSCWLWALAGCLLTLTMLIFFSLVVLVMIHCPSGLYRASNRHQCLGNKVEFLDLSFLNIMSLIFLFERANFSSSSSMLLLIKYQNFPSWDTVHLKSSL